jgi:hypothetical protein
LSNNTIANLNPWINQHQQQPGDEDASVEEFAELASDLETVWNDAHVDIRLKKRIVRTLIEDVIVDIDRQAEVVVRMIHWIGGIHTELCVPRRRRGKATATNSDTIDAVRILSRICSDDAIAAYLNRNGLLTGRGNRFTRERIVSLRSHHKIACHTEEAQRAAGWMNLSEAAKILGVSNRTLTGDRPR